MTHRPHTNLPGLSCCRCSLKADFSRNAFVVDVARLSCDLCSGICWNLLLSTWKHFSYRAFWFHFFRSFVVLHAPARLHSTNELCCDGKVAQENSSLNVEWLFGFSEDIRVSQEVSFLANWTISERQSSVFVGQEIIVNCIIDIMSHLMWRKALEFKGRMTDNQHHHHLTQSTLSLITGLQIAPGFALPLSVP